MHASNRIHFVLAFLLLAFALALTGCGGGNSSVNAQGTVPNPTGSPGANIGPPPTSNPSPTPIPTPVGIQPSQFLYVANADARLIYGFKIDPKTGAPTAILGSPFASPFPPVLMKPIRNFLLVGDATQSGSFEEYTIDAVSGALTLTMTSSPFASKFQPGPLLIPSQPPQVNLNASVADTSGHVYISGTQPGVPSNGIPNSIAAISVDASGTPTLFSNSPSMFPIDGVSAVPGPLALDPTGHFLYAVFVACFIAPCPNGPVGENGSSIPFNTLATIKLLPDASLDGFAPNSPLKIADFFLTSHDRCFTPASLAVHPTGKFLYLDCPGDDVMTVLVGGGAGRANNARVFGIQAYLVNSGTFTLLETLDCCEMQAVLDGVMMDPKGRFLLALTEGVSVFAIDQSTGILTQVPGSPFAATSGDFASQLFPRSFAIENTGSFVYAVRGSDLTLLSFSLNPTTGTLTQLPGATSAVGPGSIFSMQVAQP